jgi:hypothetical protein
MFIGHHQRVEFPGKVVVHALETAPAGQFAVDEYAEQNLGILAALLEFGPGAG